MLLTVLLGGLCVPFVQATPSISEDTVKAAVDKKAALSALSLGSHLFVLAPGGEKEVQDKRTGLLTTTYTYNAQNAPAKIREAVEIDIHTGNRSLIREGAAINRIVGPLKWKHEDYEISSIKITIYPKDVLNSLYWEWGDEIGKDCVFMHTKFPFNGSYVNKLNTPTGAFTTKDGRTVKVEVFVTSADGEEYNRQCKVKAPGVVYEKFLNLVDRLKRNLNK